MNEKGLKKKKKGKCRGNRRRTEEKKEQYDETRTDRKGKNDK